MEQLVKLSALNESTSCSKPVILNGKSLTPRKLIIINPKKRGITLECTAALKPLELPPEEVSLQNLSKGDNAYQKNEPSLSSEDNKQSEVHNKDKVGISCSDFQEFEAKFYREIVHKDPVLSRVNSDTEESQVYDSTKFIEVVKEPVVKVYSRRRRKRNDNTDVVMEGIRKEEEKQISRRVGRPKHKNRKQTSLLANRQLVIRREIERYLMQERRQKIRTISTQTTLEMSTNSTQTEELREPQQQQNLFVEPLTSFYNMDEGFYLTAEGADANFGQGPTLPPIVSCDMKDSNLLELQTVNSVYKSWNEQNDNEKLLFFNSLNNCMQVRSMGNLNIHIAVCQNDVAEVQRQCLALKLRQISVDTYNDNTMTPLHLAITNECKPQIIQLLLKFGADITLLDSEGNNPIHLAVIYNAEVILAILLAVAKQKKIKVDSFNYEGFTPLMLATIERNVDFVKMLLEAGANPNLKDQKSGRTSLFHAVESNNLDLVQLLLKYKGNTRIANFFGTSTHEAIFELDTVSHEIKALVIGKDSYQHRKKVMRGRKRRGPIYKENATATSRKPKLKIVKLLKKVA